MLLSLKPAFYGFEFILFIFRIYLFTCVIIHWVCLVSVECRVHYGNKKITHV